MYHDAVLNRLFDRVIVEYAEFHFYAWDDDRDEVVGVGNAVPAAWDGKVAGLPDGASTPSSKPGSPTAPRHPTSSRRFRSRSRPNTAGTASAAA